MCPYRFLFPALQRQQAGHLRQYAVQYYPHSELPAFPEILVGFHNHSAGFDGTLPVDFVCFPVGIPPVFAVLDPLVLQSLRLYLQLKCTI